MGMKKSKEKTKCDLDGHMKNNQSVQEMLDNMSEIPLELLGNKNPVKYLIGNKALIYTALPLLKKIVNSYEYAEWIEETSKLGDYKLDYNNKNKVIK